MTGPSPAGRRHAAKAASSRKEHFDGIPDELVVAIKAAATMPDVPAQGFPELRQHILAGGPRPDEERLTVWLEAQQRAKDMLPEVQQRLLPAKPGFVPPHHLEWWYEVLHYPWAEDLLVAVTYGLAVHA